MTALLAMLGLLPIALSHQRGDRLQGLRLNYYCVQLEPAASVEHHSAALSAAGLAPSRCQLEPGRRDAALTRRRGRLRYYANGIT